MASINSNPRSDLDPAELGLETRLVRGGLERTPYGEQSEAIFMTQAFVYDTAARAEARFANEDPGYSYSRYRNPTLEMFEQRLRLLEGAEACHGTGSGMAAVFAALACQLSAGDHLVAARALFGSCHHIITQILPRFGVETTLVDGTDLNAWRNALRPNTKVFFLETPSNPTLELIDIAGVAEIAHSVGARVVIDNVFATPIFQRPGPLGADVIVYSATKHIDGQGRCLGGAVLCSKSFSEELLQPFLRHTGPSLSPFNAWLLLKGLETLSLRVERAAGSALALAQRLDGQAATLSVRHPFLPSHPQYALAKRQMSGGGTLIAVDLKGGKRAAFAFLDALRIIDVSNNLGDAKSLATHPASTTHRAIPEADQLTAGVTQGLVRLSIGLESLADLEADLDRALAAAAAVS